MKDKIYIIALFGKSGAGKDFLKKELIKNSDIFKEVINYTTRPKRDYEENGKNYYFTDPDTFAKKILDGSMIEASVFNNWLYGTSIENLDKDKINVGVFNINAIECLLENDRLKVYPILIEARNKIRLERLLKREKDPNCKEICRRFLKDEGDFLDIPFEYETFINEREPTEINFCNIYTKRIKWAKENNYIDEIFI